jgi:hypothetical protein
MVSESVRNFLVMYFSILLPLIFFVIAVMTGANVLILILILVWLIGGFMIVFLPTHPEESS